MSFLFWILLLLFHTELYDFFLFLFLPQSFGQAAQEYVHSLVILIFLYCIKGALPPLKWSCLLPSPFSLSPSQPFTLSKIFKNFMSFSQVAFKNFFHMLKASLWFVQKTFAGAFLDALSTEFSIQLLPLSLHFKVFPHLHSVLTCLSFPFFLSNPLTRHTLPASFANLPNSLSFLFYFSYFTLVLCRWPDHLSFHIGKQNHGHLWRLWEVETHRDEQKEDTHNLSQLCLFLVLPGKKDNPFLSPWEIAPWTRDDQAVKQSVWQMLWQINHFWTYYVIGTDLWGHFYFDSVFAYCAKVMYKCK